MKDVQLAPDPNLMDSMRAVGYTTETAIADVIDNSISALAGTVDILFAASPEPYVAIVDDGVGMGRDGLIEAMRLAGRSPAGTRDEHDLGRFGLGLKTASLSQCRCLTVVSKRDGELNGVRWSLGHLVATGAWTLQLLEHTDIAGLPGVERLSDRESGTLVLWTDLDRMVTPDIEPERELNDRMIRARDHLALVFHRFIGQATPPLTQPLVIKLNGAWVPTVDPFLTRHKSVHEGPEETLRVRDSSVRVKPYTLPYLNRLSAKDRTTALIDGTLRDTQGFYIYRAGRLVQWGTWFRLMPKNDMSKLARVRVDIPNSLDDLWALDIKKSAAVPPTEVKQQLKRLAGQIVAPSQRVQRFRGRPAGSSDRIERLWSLIEERDTFRYEINDEHPLVRALSAQLPPESQEDLAKLLRTVQSTFPVEDAHNRLSEDTSHAPTAIDDGNIAALARTMRATMGCDVSTLVERVALIEPFTQVLDLQTFMEKVFDDERP